MFGKSEVPGDGGTGSTVVGVDGSFDTVRKADHEGRRESQGRARALLGSLLLQGEERWGGSIPGLWGPEGLLGFGGGHYPHILE